MTADERVERINFLARKSRTEGLSEEEKAEQARLRREYIDIMKANLVNILDSTSVEYPDGTRHKLKKKD